jgi:hypothetical protein
MSNPGDPAATLSGALDRYNQMLTATSETSRLIKKAEKEGKTVEQVIAEERGSGTVPAQH